MAAAFVLIIAITVLVAMPTFVERREARLPRQLRQRELDELDQETVRRRRVRFIHSTFVG